MTRQRNKLREDVQFRILRLLQDNPEMSQRGIGQGRWPQYRWHSLRAQRID